MRIVLPLLATAGLAGAFAPSSPAFTRTSTEINMAGMSRLDFVKAGALATAGAVLAGQASPAFAEEVTLPSGVKYEVVKSGTGPKPSVGELAGIRFKAVVKETGNKIDDIFDTPEPYYTRVGSGGLIKGVEEVLPSMRVGDRWTLTVPGNLAFGSKGRPASAGKPRIPSDATIIFEVEMVSLPGKEQELIDLIGDD
jgi:peptidylprolyl isomerase